jgi:hypothetical protein
MPRNRSNALPFDKVVNTKKNGIIALIILILPIVPLQNMCKIHRFNNIEIRVSELENDSIVAKINALLEQNTSSEQGCNTLKYV